MKKKSLLEKIQIGQIVRSKQGRDKDRLYVVMAKDDRFIYTADGSKWTAAKPKKKNAVHLQIINQSAEQCGDAIKDADIMEAIKSFESRKGN